MTASLLTQPDKVEPSSLTDTGNALLFVDIYGNGIRYVHDLGKWIVWDGTRWKVDDVAEIVEIAKNAVMYLYHIVAEHGNEWGLDNSGKPVQARVLAWASTSLNANKLTALLKLAQSDERVAITSDQLDTHLYLLPCADGMTLDLKTFEYRASDPAEYMTKCTGIPFDPEARMSPVSQKFLEDITCKDEALEEYLQKIAGYSLTGDVSRRLVFFLHGQSGRNGKSTYLEQMRLVLGDFATIVPMATLEKQQFSKGGSAATPDIAKLKGARFVTCQESEQDMKLSAAKIKELVGNDTITARALYKSGIEFKPQCKIFLATNFRPNIPARVGAVWDRLRLVPFNYIVDESNINRTLGDELAADAVAWLSWMAGGLYMLTRDGLDTPEAVANASQNYRQDMDTFSDFIAGLREHDDDIAQENTERLANGLLELPSTDYSCGKLYEQYVATAKTNGWESLDPKAFHERMIDRGFTKTSKHPRRWVWPSDPAAKPSYSLQYYLDLAAEQGAWDVER